MTKEKTKSALDRKYEDQFARAMAEALEPDGVHFNVGMEDNPRLQVFNQVLQDLAKKNVN